MEIILLLRVAVFVAASVLIYTSKDDFEKQQAEKLRDCATTQSGNTKLLSNSEVCIYEKSKETETNA